MILNEDQMTRLGSEIIGKSLSGNMRWSIGENKRFVAALPGQYFVEVGSEQANRYVVEVKGPDDQVLGRLIGSDGDPGIAGRIHSAAESQAGTSVFQEIMDSLRFADEAKADVVPRVTLSDVSEVRAPDGREVAPQLYPRG